MVYKTALSFALVPSPTSKLVTSSFPFFCWGKMLSKNYYLLCACHYRYLLRIRSVYYRRLPFLLGEMVYKTALSFALVLLRILSVYYRRLFFSAGVKMLSKTAPCFALVVTGTFSKFLACITVVFLFCWGEMVYKTALSFALVPSPNSKLVTSSFPFFCWGKMLSKTTTAFALVITGTFSEFVPCITVVFLFC